MIQHQFVLSAARIAVPLQVDSRAAVFSFFVIRAAAFSDSFRNCVYGFIFFRCFHDDLRIFDFLYYQQKYGKYVKRSCRSSSGYISITPEVVAVASVPAVITAVIASVAAVITSVPAVTVTRRASASAVEIVRHGKSPFSLWYETGEKQLQIISNRG